MKGKNERAETEERGKREALIYDNKQGRGRDDYRDYWDMEILTAIDHEKRKKENEALFRKHFTGKRILMLGCGSNTKADILAEYASAVVGIDISPEQIRLSRECNCSEKVKLSRGRRAQPSLCRR